MQWLETRQTAIAGSVRSVLDAFLAQRDQSRAALCQVSERRHKCPFSRGELQQVFRREKEVSAHNSSLVRLHMLSQLQASKWKGFFLSFVFAATI